MWLYWGLGALPMSLIQGFKVSLDLGSPQSNDRRP